MYKITKLTQVNCQVAGQPAAARTELEHETALLHRKSLHGSPEVLLLRRVAAQRQIVPQSFDRDIKLSTHLCTQKLDKFHD